MHSLRYRMSKTITQVHVLASQNASPPIASVFVGRRLAMVLLPPADFLFVHEPACTAVCHTHPFRGVVLGFRV